MAALTDLTWQQLVTHLPAGSIYTFTDPEDGPKVIIDITNLLNGKVDALTDVGVVKFFSVIFAAANKAQIAANETQAEGEKLAAFAPATIGTAVNGYITLTRPFVCRAELASSVNIIGTNA